MAAGDTYTANSTAEPAAQFSMVYLTSYATLPSKSFGSASDKGSLLGVMQETLQTSLALKAFASLLSTLLLASCHSADMERQMQALCKVDGGVRVYDSVALPASYFNNLGGVRDHSSMPTGRTDGSWFSRIGDDEYRVITTRTYVAGQPSLGYNSGESLVRSHTGIYRWPENRLIGEEVTYEHGYGTRFSFGFQPGGTHCPKERRNLYAAVFRQQK
jgi:hypothetical protein